VGTDKRFKEIDHESRNRNYKNDLKQSFNFKVIEIGVSTHEKHQTRNENIFEVKGLFYSHKLTNENDENYWSVTNPLLLIMSAMRQIEIVNRNTQGVNDWTNSIAAEMTQLGMDLVEEIIAEVSEMGG
jgi:hypothetical protein